jgi:cell division protein FtsA
MFLIKKVEPYLGCLDIGSSKVCCAIKKLDTKQDDDEHMSLVGFGECESKGMKGAYVVSLEELRDSIINAVHQAEKGIDSHLKSVCVTLPASYCHSKLLSVSISIPDNELIDTIHLKKLLSLKDHPDISIEHYVIHAIPIAYSVDSHHHVQDPKGMYGSNLTAHLHVVTIPKTFLRALQQTIERCHLTVNQWVAAPYASGLATLVEDEIELGATVIDFGGGQTSFATFVDGNLVYIGHIPIGGKHITQDIAKGISVPIGQSERLKNLYGTLIASSADDRESILVPQIGMGGSSLAKQISRSLLTKIIKARAEETMENIWHALKKSGMDRIGGQRLIITGGGSQLPGLRDSLAELTGKHVRLATPMGVKGIEHAKNPTYSACFGGLYFAQKNNNSQANQSGFWDRFFNRKRA